MYHHHHTNITTNTAPISPHPHEYYHHCTNSTTITTPILPPPPHQHITTTTTPIPPPQISPPPHQYHHHHTNITTTTPITYHFCQDQASLHPLFLLLVKLVLTNTSIVGKKFIFLWNTQKLNKINKRLEVHWDSWPTGLKITKKTKPLRFNVIKRSVLLCLYNSK